MHAQISIGDVTDSVVWRNTRLFYKGLSWNLSTDMSGVKLVITSLPFVS